MPRSKQSSMVKRGQKKKKTIKVDKPLRVSKLATAQASVEASRARTLYKTTHDIGRQVSR